MIGAASGMPILGAFGEPFDPVPHTASLIQLKPSPHKCLQDPRASHTALAMSETSQTLKNSNNMQHNIESKLIYYYFKRLKF